MDLAKSTIYVLCVLTSLLAMALLLRSYWQNRSRLLLWSAAAFVAFAVEQPSALPRLRHAAQYRHLAVADIDGFIGVAILLYAFVWEID